MAKTLANESLIYGIIGAAGITALLAATAPAMGVSLSMPFLWSLSPWAGGLLSGTASILLGHDYISSLPWRRLKVAFETTGLYIEKQSSIRLPQLHRKNKKPWGWELCYKLPIGMSLRQIEGKREELEQAVDGEIVLARRKNMARIEILQGQIPRSIPFELPDCLPGEAPFIAGISRAGLITRSIETCYNVLIAGSSGAGKSTELHSIVVTVATLGNHVNLNLVDLKRVEFGYMRPFARAAHNLQGAIQILEYLTGEMYRRMEFLDCEDYENVREWRKVHSDRISELPYEILFIDELAEMSPFQSDDPTEKEQRKYSRNMLFRLNALGRSMGIFLVLATQYPNKEILPGILKMNMPVKIGFKTQTDMQSRVILENGRAALLPTTEEIPGRAIFQHGIEREIQCLHLPLVKAKKIVREHFAATGRKPPTLESTALPAPGIFKDLPLPEEVLSDDLVSEGISSGDSGLPDDYVSPGHEQIRPGAFKA